MAAGRSTALAERPRASRRKGALDTRTPRKLGAQPISFMNARTRPHNEKRSALEKKSNSHFGGPEELKMAMGQKPVQ